MTFPAPITGLFAAFLLLLSGCALAPEQSRYQSALSVAGPADLIVQEIPAPPFRLTSFARINAPETTARVYIEGDGLAWLGRRRVSLDPTPTDPVALRLAAQDVGENVIYLARPCQYSGWTGVGPCPVKYWTSHRFAPEVVKAFSAALDDIKSRYELEGFELVGFSGGGAMAVLIAAQRGDILSIRTIAGNLDHRLVNDLHNVSPLHGSLNPADMAGQVATIPQLHLIGGRDPIITPDIYKSFRQAAGDTSCMQASIIDNASHEDGWEKIWAEVLRQPVTCRPAQE